MRLNKLKDQELLRNTKELVLREREVMTKILHHLKEVERRKLFSDLGYKNLFSYAVKELKYSESQAYRRIQAMRLLKDHKEVEEKIEKGSLSLSNITQAQTYFNENKSTIEEKKEILQKLENQSAREGQKILLSMQPEKPLPKERERIVTPKHIEVKFIMDEELKEKLEELRSLLGPKARDMKLADLISLMADHAILKEKEKKFGKASTLQKPCVTNSNNPRYISKSLKHQVWLRDKGQCTKCGSKHNLQYDHHKPIKLGGSSTLKNLRLLCANCNSRQAIKAFGVKTKEIYLKRH